MAPELKVLGVVCVGVRSCKLNGTSRPLFGFLCGIFWVNFIPRRCFCLLFFVMGIFLRLSSWVEHGTLELRCSQGVECFGKLFSERIWKWGFEFVVFWWCYLKWFQNGFPKEFWKRKCIVLQWFWKVFSVYGETKRPQASIHRILEVWSS